MKQLVPTVIMTIALAIVLSACNTSMQTDRDIDLVNDENLRKQIYMQILENDTLFDQFMEAMMNHEPAFSHMMQDREMMRTFFRAHNLNYIMQHHSDMNEYMMQNMMEIAARDTAMLREWDHMMRERQSMHGEQGMH